MVSIRQAIEKDAETINDFQIKMALETEKLHLDQDIVSKGVENVFKNPENGIYYVANVEDKIIASLLVTFEWSDWRNGKVLWIQSVYVVPEYRRQGVFGKMYNYLKEIVENEEFYKGLRLYVDVNNTPAQKVYEALGMNGSHYKLFEWMVNS